MVTTVKTVSVQEAANNLGHWVRRALEGDQIRIRQGDAAVELRPATVGQPAETKTLAEAKAALQRLQNSASLAREDANAYLAEVKAERTAVDRGRRS